MKYKVKKRERVRRRVRVRFSWKELKGLMLINGRHKAKKKEKEWKLF